MRTTVTLDADVAAKLQAIVRERGQSFKSALNDALRAGLTVGTAEATPYSFPSRRLGMRAGIDLDRALSLAEALEDAEIVRKLDLRK